MVENECCLVSKPGPLGLRRTPCEKIPNPTNCKGCPFWDGVTEHVAAGTRGGEFPKDSAAWTKHKWSLGLSLGE